MTQLSEHLQRLERAVLAIKSQQPLAVATAELVIKGTSNGSQGTTRNGWQARRGMQRRIKSRGLELAMELQTRALLARHGGLVVRMVRVAPRPLDDDNLAAAFKRLRDAIAKSTGVHDASPMVVYVPDAEKGDEHLVRVEVYEQLTEIEAAAVERVVSQDVLGDRPGDVLAMVEAARFLGRPKAGDGFAARVSPNVRRAKP